MADNSLEERVFRVEQVLQEIATRGDCPTLNEQILQLQLELRSEFSAVRAEMRAGEKDLRELMEQRTAEILAVVHAGARDTLRAVRVLHQDIVGRMAGISRG